MDQKLQKETIERIYDEGAHLESPYMVANFPNFVGFEWKRRDYKVLFDSVCQ